MDKATLVTGGTGLIGYNIIRSLLKRKRRVRALVRSVEKGHKLFPGEVEVVKGDILDPESIESAMQGCEVVYHSAGWPEQWLADVKVFDLVNVEGTRYMVTAAKKADIKKFIYTSTIDVFEGANGEEFDESKIDLHPKHTHYERSKQKAFIYILEELKNGFPAINIHPAGLYGPGPAASPGMNNFFLDLKAGKIPMLLPGGLPLVFSEDVGEGHVLAEEKGKIGESYILSDSYFTLKELASVFLQKIGSGKKAPTVMPMPIVKTVSAIGETLSKLTKKPPLIPKGQMVFLQWGAIPNSEKAQQELGWQITPIQKGLDKTIDYLFSGK